MQSYKIFFLDHRSYCINSLGDSLAQLGHQIMYQSSWVPAEVEAGIAYFKPDILITVGFNYSLFGNFLDIIPKLCKKYQLFHIYWATEDKIHHNTWSQDAIKRSRPDYVLTIHPDCVENYTQYGVPSSYFNFAYNPRIFPPKGKHDVEIYDIAFVGATHLFTKTYRFDSLQHLLFPLVKHNIKTNIWGSGWRKHKEFVKREFGCVIPSQWIHGNLPYKRSSKVYRTSKIILGVQNADDQVTQRTFEILGTGAFMIASRTQELSRLFVDRQDIALTSSPEETISLIHYYRNRPELRHQIGKNARQKVLANHTYHQQISDVWPIIEPYIRQKRTTLQ